jgi:hypothetical protein
MRTDWVPLSASALVIGVISLVFGSVLNPADMGATTDQLVTIVGEESEQWTAMAVLFLFASVSLVLGLPCVLMLFDRRGRRLGLVGVSLLVVGSVATCGYATMMLLFRALVANGALEAGELGKLSSDRGLGTFLAVWVLSFYLGVLAVAVGLLRAGTTPRWVPLVLLAFVLAGPFSTSVGRVGAAVQVMALAVAFTGVAMTAVSDERQEALTRRSVL